MTAGRHVTVKSSRNNFALAVAIPQVGSCLLADHDVHDVRHDLLHAGGRARASQVRVNPAGRQQKKCTRCAGLAGRVAPHECVERGIATSLDFVPTLVVVCHASLSRRHDSDEACFSHKAIKHFYGPHGTERIGHNEADKFFGRDFGDGFERMEICDPGIDKQRVKTMAGESIL